MKSHLKWLLLGLVVLILGGLTFFYVTKESADLSIPCCLPDNALSNATDYDSVLSGMQFIYLSGAQARKGTLHPDHTYDVVYSLEYGGENDQRANYGKGTWRVQGNMLELVGSEKIALNEPITYNAETLVAEVSVKDGYGYVFSDSTETIVEYVQSEMPGWENEDLSFWLRLKPNGKPTGGY